MRASRAGGLAAALVVAVGLFSFGIAGPAAAAGTFTTDPFDGTGYLGACVVHLDRGSFAANATVTVKADCLNYPTFDFRVTGTCATLAVNTSTGAAFQQNVVTFTGTTCANNAATCSDFSCESFFLSGTFVGPALAFRSDWDPASFVVSACQTTGCHRFQVRGLTFGQPDTVYFPCSPTPADFPECVDEDSAHFIQTSSDTTAAVEGVDERLTLGLALCVFFLSGLFVARVGRS